MTYQERKELNELSKKVFGALSKWQKICDAGVPEPMEREREVMVPDGKGGITKKIFTDRKSVIKHYSPQEIRKIMEEIIEKRTTVPTAGESIINMTEIGTLSGLESGMSVELDNSSEVITIK